MSEEKETSVFRSVYNEKGELVSKKRVKTPKMVPWLIGPCGGEAESEFPDSKIVFRFELDESPK